ncbi:cytochrome P450 [Lophiostoma macrostomum CBS 122681]|uniref:Cytochrome P450 n=1 Tax=Lophiostoma macrostomum CBS 122681 TaxID=1314788 RepID=A0A6A6SPJ8_9PLEO|nr:cytochrome P450 [Lophiostoma macrostomum CBS 122681]
MTLTSALSPLLHASTSLRLVIFLILAPFLIQYLSTTFFYRRARSISKSKTPPTLPYSIPGIFHVFGLLRHGPPVFFANAIREYGDFAPFVIKAGPTHFLIIRSAEHVKKVFQSVKQMTVTDFHAQIYEKIMGTPKEAVQLYQDIGKGRKESDAIDHAHLALPRQYFSGTALVSMVDVYIATLRRNMSNKMIQEKFWTEIEDMWSFFQNEIARATMETIFGSELLRMHPRIVRDFWEFDKNVEQLFRGLPRFMMPTAYNTRDRLVGNLSIWLQSVHPGTDFAKTAEEDPEWDAKSGSKFFQARDAVFANNTLDYQARAAEALAIMQGSTSNTMPSTFWFILETLRNTELNKYIHSEIKGLFDPVSGKYDVGTLTSLPIIQSMHAEIGRLRMATGTLRQCQVDGFQLDEDWSLPKGVQVMIFSHDLALNTPLWASARPQTVERPLEEFWPERFIVPDKPAREKRGQIRTGRFSMEGIGALHSTFGGGSHLCPGRYLAKAIQAATLVVLLCEYEVLLPDPESVEESMPPLREVAIGQIRPLEKVRVRIRKRRVGGDGKMA